ncbi:hypothetical protein [Pseudoruegeria sp. HB172150]|uniref:hypothetical protein n=1 Tax=Pseudoruegeria sp. HB172150 TaxID=2721164 RepID=UPI0015543F3D|nr:hypothetical protein [Pseudoruegeria sp. HB172150]
MALAAGTIFSAGLAACDSPSAGFANQPARYVTVGDAVFSVRYTPFAAEAIRLNADAAPDRAGILRLAAEAIAAVSGCRLRSSTLEGDSTVVRAEIDCPGAGRRPVPRPQRLELECGFVGQLPWDGETREFECVALP